MSTDYVTPPAAASAAMTTCAGRLIRYPDVSANILDGIGDKPWLEIEGIFGKLEFLNRSGSIKAGIAQKYLSEHYGDR